MCKDVCIHAFCRNKSKSFALLTHEQQQKAVEQIQELMAQGISSGEAIQIVAKALREIHQKGEKEASDSK